VNEIVKVQGISNLTALRLKAALALGRKLLQPEEDHPTIHSPADAAEILMPMLAHREQEYMVVMPLDTRKPYVGCHRNLPWIPKFLDGACR